MLDTYKEYPNGGKIDIYSIVDREASDFDNILACCDYFAKKGDKTIIYPRFDVTTNNPQYQEIFAFLKDTPYWGKCPDFSVNGAWYEHEGYKETKDLTNHKKQLSTFCNMLGRGVKQSDRVVVEECNVGRHCAKKTIFNRVHYEHQNITEVYIRTANGLELIYKKEAG